MHTEFLDAASSYAPADESPQGEDPKGIEEEVSRLAERRGIHGMERIRDIAPPYMDKRIGCRMKPHDRLPTCSGGFAGGI